MLAEITGMLANARINIVELITGLTDISIFVNFTPAGPGRDCCCGAWSSASPGARHALQTALPVRVVIASDAKRGHENQSRVVARMLGDREPLVLHLRPRIEELPLRLRLALFGPRRAQQPCARRSLCGACLQPEHPEAVPRLRP